MSYSVTPIYIPLLIQAFPNRYNLVSQGDPHRITTLMTAIPVPTLVSIPGYSSHKVGHPNHGNDTTGCDKYTYVLCLIEVKVASTM